VSGGLTGTYPWQSLVLEPSARVFALWEHENAYTDSLNTLQPARNFETGRASVGAKVAYPFAWSSTVALSPYAGLYADYYFSQDDAQTVGLTAVPLLQGFAARATGGLVATFAGGASLGAGGEFGGIGSDNHSGPGPPAGGFRFERHCEEPTGPARSGRPDDKLQRRSDSETCDGRLNCFATVRNDFQMSQTHLRVEHLSKKCACAATRIKNLTEDHNDRAAAATRVDAHCGAKVVPLSTRADAARPVCQNILM
jgi:Autotransporter beta-domain